MAKKKKTFRFNRIKIFVLIGVLVYASLTFFNQQTILASQISRQEELNAKQMCIRDRWWNRQRGKSTTYAEGMY